VAAEVVAEVVAVEMEVPRVEVPEVGVAVAPRPWEAAMLVQRFSSRSVRAATVTERKPP
jgi:hypothetical protein